MEQLRRLLPRQFTNWRGKYLFEDESEQRWRNCRVLDVSSAGAGLELLETAPGQPVGTRILLAVHLRGELRNSEPTKSDHVRAGIQFVDLSAEERFYLDSLAELQAAW